MSRKYILTNYYTKKPITITDCCPSCGKKWKWQITDLGESYSFIETPWWYGRNEMVTLREPHKKLSLECPKCHLCESIEYSDYEIVDE